MLAVEPSPIQFSHRRFSYLTCTEIYRLGCRDPGGLFGHNIGAHGFAVTPLSARPAGTILNMTVATSRSCEELNAPAVVSAVRQAYVSGVGKLSSQ